MTEFEREILKTIVEVMRTGGAQAIWGIVFYFTYQLIKLTLIGGLIWGLTKTILAFCNNLLVHLKEKASTKISLISNQLETQLQKTIANFQDSTTSSLQDLTTYIKSLQKENPSKNSTEDANNSSEQLKN